VGYRLCVVSVHSVPVVPLDDFFFAVHVYTDIIALLVVGVLFIAIFLYWQHYLEKIQDDPNAPYSVWTPPPLMRLTIWTRANGRFAATLAIAFTNWCAFMAWTFWVQVGV